MKKRPLGRGASRMIIAATAVGAVGLCVGATPARPLASDAGRVAKQLPTIYAATDNPGWAEMELLQSLRRESRATGRYVGDTGQVVSSRQLRRFLQRVGSPMAPHASDLIAAANKYDVDPRFIVAVAGVESSFGKRCRGHNAWGWNNGKTRWSSWPEAIDSYARLISEKYPNWRNIHRMAPRYNPNTPEAWGRKVAQLMASIERAPA